MADETLDPMERLMAERACERLILEVVRTLDLGDPPSVVGLFTPDGVWEWPGGDRRVEGRDALLTYFRSRPTARAVVRSWTT